MLPAIDEFMLDLEIGDEAQEESPDKVTELSSCLFGFFSLYGKDYQMQDQVISVRAGRWLEPSNFSANTSFSRRR